MRIVATALCIGDVAFVTGIVRELVVDGTSASGTITFDPDAFSPSDPATIYLRAGLPPIMRDRLTIDTSDAGAS